MPHSQQCIDTPKPEGFCVGAGCYFTKADYPGLYEALTGISGAGEMVTVNWFDVSGEPLWIEIEEFSLGGQQAQVPKDLVNRFLAARKEYEAAEGAMLDALKPFRLPEVPHGRAPAH